MMKHEELVSKTRQLLATRSLCDELRAAAEEYLASGGDAASQQAYIRQLKRGLMPVDALLNIFSSEMAAMHFGPQRAMEILEHAQELMDVGRRFCDCPACAADQEILALFGEEV